MGRKIKRQETYDNKEDKMNIIALNNLILH